LADARRILEINPDANPFLDAEGRREIRLAKRVAWQILADVTEQLVETLDVAAGDPNLEANGDELDGSICEDVPLFHDEHPMRAMSAGCEISDGDVEHDGCEREEGL
jgi:hypothetical protein